MSWYEKIDAATPSLIVAGVASGVSGFLWLVRKIVTNEKKVDMMRQEIKFRDEQRKQDREDMHGLKVDIKELRSELHKIFEKH